MWVDKEMKVKRLVERRANSAKDYVKLLLSRRIESSGITKGLIIDIRINFKFIIADEKKNKGNSK